ncbi:retrovirus-related pol polyprotein from transposon TNT 1-94 [Tanacetum coccineum]
MYRVCCVVFKEEGIEHQTSTPRTPEQKGVVERRNHTLVEAARTMLSASKLPLFFWAKAIATAYYTQNRSIIIPTVGFQKFLQLSAATYTSYYCQFYLVLLVKNAKDSRK